MRAELRNGRIAFVTKHSGPVGRIRDDDFPLAVHFDECNRALHYSLNVQLSLG
jgi:hypothetical protein